jgi:hypothetical protein
VAQALALLGHPLPPAATADLDRLTAADGPAVAAVVRKHFDPLCVATVTVGKTGVTAVAPAGERHELVEQGWRQLLVKVVNPVGTTGRLRADSPAAAPRPRRRCARPVARAGGVHRPVAAARPERAGAGVHRPSGVQPGRRAAGRRPVVGKLVLRFWATFGQPGVGQVFWWTKERPQPWGEYQVQFNLRPNEPGEYEVPLDCDGELVGLRIDPGNDPGTAFDWITLSHAEDPAANTGTARVGFDVRPSVPVTFRVAEPDGSPTTAGFAIRDARNRVYPAQPKRLAPDLFFQPQVYRAAGETVRLPAGKYTVMCSRGSESVPETKELVVGDKPATLAYQVKRWTDPARRGWHSGDHHIHAAGCQHNEHPTEGVEPADMMRYVLGEDLKVGCYLTWGPRFDYQKRFFTGRPSDRSTPGHLLRYDVEVSGFGSHQAGHLNLLNRRSNSRPAAGPSTTGRRSG